MAARCLDRPIYSRARREKKPVGEIEREREAALLANLWGHFLE
jgi:hypothetical protein